MLNLFKKRERPGADILKTDLLGVPNGTGGLGTDSKSDIPAQAANVGTGTLKWSRINALMDMGVQKVYKLYTRSGLSIETTANHPYLVRLSHNKPEQLSTGGTYEIDQSNRIEDLSKTSYVAIANEHTKLVVRIDTKTKNALFASYKNKNSLKLFAPEVFAKAINMLVDKLELTHARLVLDIEYPGYDDIITRIIKTENPTARVDFDKIGKSSLAHKAAYRYGATGGNKKSAVEPNMGTEALLHFGMVTKDSQIAHGLTLEKYNTKWEKVQYLKPGMVIATVNGWEPITAIYATGNKQTWDIEVEGTHNFVGNGILAHNTYINGNLSANKDSADADALILNIQNTGANVFSVDAEGDFFYDGTGSSPASDYAEYFRTEDEGLAAGEAVCIDISNPNSVTRCRGASDSNIMGIVSTKPALVGNAKPEFINNPKYKTIAMLGQIPAKVSNENGAVKIGDSLTSSSIPGYLMKANAGDSTVGVALEGLPLTLSGVASELPSGATLDTIQVMISRRNKSLTVEAVEEKVAERIASMKIEDEVNLLVANAVSSLTPKNTLSLDENGNVILSSNPAQAIDLLANNQSLVTLQSDYESLRNSLESRISDIENNILGSEFEKEYTVSSEVIENSIVSYNGQGVVLANSDNRDNILGVVKAVESGEDDVENVAKIITRGRAFITVTNENGDILKGDPITVSSGSNGLGVNAITEGMIIGYALHDAEYNDENQSSIEIAVSPVWHLASVDNLSIDNNVADLSGSTSLTDLTISNDSLLYGNLSVMGDSRFTNIIATGDLSVGLITLSADGNSINVAGGVLKLQNEYGAGDIDIFSGKIVMTNTGSIRILAEIVAHKYNVDTSDVAGASAGKVVVKAGEKDVIVETTALTDNSLVFVTAENSTDAFTYEIIFEEAVNAEGEQASGVVGIRIYTSNPVEKDTMVNWWIVN